MFNWITGRLKFLFKTQKDLKKESYYELLMNPATKSDFKRIFSFEVQNAIVSSAQIKFRDIPWGAGFKEVETLYMNPTYKISKRFEGFEHDIWFYKVKINDHKTITQLHFINGRLAIVTRLFRDLMRQNIPVVLDEVFREMKINADASSNQFSHVVDEFGNLMQISIDFSLQYKLVGDYKSVEQIIEF